MENLNITELNYSELQNTNGGYIKYVGSFALWVFDNWDEISESYNEGYNAARN